MKSFTFRKNWNVAISKMAPEKRQTAIVYVYEFIMNGSNPNPEDNELWDLLKLVEADLKKAEINREKARKRREEKKIDAARAKEQAEITDVKIPELMAESANEYLKNPALHIFDGFMAYLALTRGLNERIEIPAGRNAVELMCHFRHWVIENNRINEITKLTSFIGLFRHALPEILAA